MVKPDRPLERLLRRSSKALGASPPPSLGLSLELDHCYYYYYYFCRDRREEVGANRRSHRLGAPSPGRPAGRGDGGHGRTDHVLGFSRVIVKRGADARVPPLPTKVREGKEGEPARNFARQTRQQRWREPSTAPTTRPGPAWCAASCAAGPRGRGPPGWRPLIGCRTAGTGGGAARYQAPRGGSRCQRPADWLPAGTGAGRHVTRLLLGPRRPRPRLWPRAWGAQA